MPKNNLLILSASLLYGLLAFFVVLLLEGLAFRFSLIDPETLSQKNFLGLFLPAFLEEFSKISLAILAFVQFKKPQNNYFLLGVPLGFGFIESYFSPKADFFSKPLFHTLFFAIGYLLICNFKIKEVYKVVIWLLISTLLHFFYNFYKLGS